MKAPMHVCYDAQGPVGIFDARGRAVMMFGSLFEPTNGYVWDEPEAKRMPDNDMGATSYNQRNRVVRQVFTLLTMNQRMSHQLDGFAKENGFDNWEDATHWISGVDLTSPGAVAAFEAWKQNDGSKAGIMKLKRREQKKEGGTPGAA